MHIFYRALQETRLRAFEAGNRRQQLYLEGNYTADSDIILFDPRWAMQNASANFDSPATSSAPDTVGSAQPTGTAPISTQPTGTAPLPSPPQTTDAAAEAWRLVRDSQNAEDFESFAAAFPDNALAATAKLRAAQLRRSGPQELRRYPAIEAPQSVGPGVTFSVLVSLQLTRDSPQTSTEQVGAGVVKAPDGAIAFAATCQPACEFEVSVQAPDLDVVPDGNNTATISMKSGESSTPAIFKLMVPAKFQGQSTRITANWYYKGQFLARAWRSVQVAAGPVQMSAARPVRAEGGPSDPPVSIPTQQRDQSNADLIIRWEEAPNARHPCQVEVASPAFGKVKSQPCTPAGELSAFLRQHYTQILAGTRGVTPHSAPRASSSAAEMRGLGLQLNKFVPPLVRDAFWALVDKEKTTPGYQFRSIEIQTNNPIFPWEIWIPERAGTAYANFTGASFVMSRWHIDDTVRMLPPVLLSLKRIDVVAPRYTGASALPHTAEEVQELSRLPEYREQVGTERSFKYLLANPPAGIVHFAGHGSAEESKGTTTYGLRLEDVELNPTLWRAYALGQTDRHPLYFLNACETGQESVVGGTVDGWASAILDTGASGFIGGLWPLSDAGAAAFAREFYKNIRLGLEKDGHVRVADAILASRRTLLSTGDPTIMSYVFYGDIALDLQR